MGEAVAGGGGRVLEAFEVAAEISILGRPSFAYFAIPAYPCEAVEVVVAGDFGAELAHGDLGRVSGRRNKRGKRKKSARFAGSVGKGVEARPALFGSLQAEVPACCVWEQGRSRSAGPSRGLPDT